MGAGEEDQEDRVGPSEADLLKEDAPSDEREPTVTIDQGAYGTGTDEGGEGGEETVEGGREEGGGEEGDEEEVDGELGGTVGSAPPLFETSAGCDLR